MHELEAEFDMVMRRNMRADTLRMAAALEMEYRKYNNSEFSAFYVFCYDAN